MIKFETPQLLNKDVDKSISSALQSLLEDSKYGFLRAFNGPFPWQNLNTFKEKLKPFQQVAILGIGGSSQGTKSFLQYIDPSAIDSDVIYFDRIDESFISRQFLKVNDVHKTAWFIVSRSGSTTETLFILNTVIHKTEGQLLSNMQNIFVITEKKDSLLGQWALEKGLFIIPAACDIEGRFSLFSESGLMPLVNNIEDFTSLQRGAQWLQQNLQMVERLAEFYTESFKEERWISNVWLYSERLRELGFWLEQLWAESLGKYKSADKRISTPFCCLGTNDQHSLLQLMEEGYPDKSQLFVQIENASVGTNTYDRNWLECRASYLEEYQLDDLMKKYCRATYESLEGHPRALITLEDTSAATIFAFHLLIALTIGTLGKYKNIEIYGQPGVEKSKKLFREML